MDTTTGKILSIVGMGPGIGQAVAERFGREGFTIAMIARNIDRLQLLQELLEKQYIPSRYYVGDAADEESLQRAFINLHGELGPTDVLLYNAAKMKKVPILQESVDSLAADFRINAGGALLAVKAVLPEMEHRGSGTILLTGGGLALQPHPDYGSLSLGKAALRSLALQLHQALRDGPVKVATLTIAGFVTPNSKTHTPQAVAEALWRLHQTPKAALDAETVL